ncbi:MAG: hypothetical protein P4L45_05050, partial [Ignavibacteriaceae bacterium]|nr:hypothetical protein [Ignavibacteriaceae bacterium]
MKLIKKESEKAGDKKTKNKSKAKPEKSVKKAKTVKKDEDVQRLVHLLQVHQIELEHQNQEL